MNDSGRLEFMSSITITGLAKLGGDESYMQVAFKTDVSVDEIEEWGNGPLVRGSRKFNVSIEPVIGS